MLETRLRNTGQQGGAGGGGSSNSAGLAGSGNLYVVTSATPLLPSSRILTAGTNVTILTDGTAIYVSATTGAAGAGGSNTQIQVNSQGVLAGGAGLTSDLAGSITASQNVQGTQIFGFSGSAQPYLYAFPMNDLTRFWQIYHTGSTGSAILNIASIVDTGNDAIFTNSVGKNFTFQNRIQQVDVLSTGNTPNSIWHYAQASTSIGTGNFSVYQVDINKNQTALATCNAFYANLSGNLTWAFHANLMALGSSQWGYVAGVHCTGGVGLLIKNDVGDGKNAIFYQNSASMAGNMVEWRAQEDPLNGNYNGTFTGNFWNCLVTGTSLAKLNSAGALSLSVALAVTNGGTGLATAGSALTLLGVNSNGSLLEYKKVTAGSSVSITYQNTGITVSALTGWAFSTLIVDSGGTGLSSFGTGLVYSISGGTAALKTFPATIGSSGISVGGQYLSARVSKGNIGSAATIDWAQGNCQFAVLTANCVLIFSNNIAGSRFLLELKQDGTGSRTITWPGSVVWGAGSLPTLTTTGSQTDIITFYYNGSNIAGAYSLGYNL